MTLEENNPAIEDDDLNTTAPNPADDDLNTTAPNPAEKVWKMPEPVFQRSSGKLHEGFAKGIEAGQEPALESSEPSSPAVEAYSAAEPIVKPKSSVLKLLLVLLGIAGMIAFLIVFLTVVYFFFLR